MKKINNCYVLSGWCSLVLCFFLGYALNAFADDIEISFHSIPEPAEIKINGATSGNTPMIRAFQPNSNFKLEIFAQGYKPWFTDYTVREAETICVDLATGKRVAMDVYRKQVQKESAPADSTSRLILIDAPPPAIPPDLIKQNISGSAAYHITITHRGKIADVQPAQSSSIAGLDEFLRQWLLQWSFEPVKREGFPVNTTRDFSIRFDLHHHRFEITDLATDQEIATIDLSNGSAPAISDASPPAAENQAPTAPTATPLVESALIDCSDSSAVDAVPVIIQPPRWGAIPLEIQNLKIKGMAIFKVLITGEGKISKAGVVTGTGSADLDNWILPILEKMEWEAAGKSGQALSCWRSITLRFDTLACRFECTDLYN
jgi:TonB family protein